jgi:hypothetical protein
LSVSGFEEGLVAAWMVWEMPPVSLGMGRSMETVKAHSEKGSSIGTSRDEAATYLVW